MYTRKNILLAVFVFLLVLVFLIYKNTDTHNAQKQTTDISVDDNQNDTNNYYTTNDESQTKKSTQREVITDDKEKADFIIEQFGLKIVPPKEIEAGFGFTLTDSKRPVSKHEELGIFTLGNYSYAELESRGERVGEVLPADYKGIEAHIYFDNGKKPDGSPYDIHELLLQYIVHSNIISKSKDRIIANESGDYYEVRRYDNFVIILWYVQGTNTSLDDMTQLSQKIKFETLSLFDPVKGLSESFIKQLESNL